MDMVFVYEDKIAQDTEGNYYTGSALPQKVFDRYLQHFDNLTLLMRRSDVRPDDQKTLKGMNRLDTSRIEVVLLPNPTESIRSYFSLKIRRQFRDTVLSQLRPDRAVIVRAPSESGMIAADYCHKKGIPYLAEAVGCPWDSLWNHSLRGKILAPRAWISFRRTMRNADYALYVTSEFLQRRYPTKGRMAAISDVELQPLDEKTLDRRCNNTYKNKIIRVGTAGALHVPYKGQRFVIEAIARLMRSGKAGFEYHLAGGGDASELKRLVEKLKLQDRVFFDGMLPHEQMFQWLDALDVYVQPSLVESMPRAVIEAMSRGLPVVGSRVGGVPELLSDEYIFQPKNSKAISEMLSALTPERMEQMARQNFEKAKQFQKDVLEQKRFEFYSAFAAEAEEKSK